MSTICGMCGGRTMSDDTNVEEERMKMCFIDFSTEETDGINVKRSSSSVRGETLDDCLKYTKMLHARKEVTIHER